jgi:hypothetical protein
MNNLPLRREKVIEACIFGGQSTGMYFQNGVKASTRAQVRRCRWYAKDFKWYIHEVTDIVCDRTFVLTNLMSWSVALKMIGRAITVNSLVLSFKFQGFQEFMQFSLNIWRG